MATPPERLSTMNVSLPEELHRSAEKRAQTQQFASLSEYVRHLIREDLVEGRQEATEEALVTSLSGERIDRKTVLKAMQEMTKLRESLNARGKAMTLEEIQAAIDEGRR